MFTMFCDCRRNHDKKCFLFLTSTPRTLVQENRRRARLVKKAHRLGVADLLEIAAMKGVEAAMPGDGAEEAEPLADDAEEPAEVEPPGDAAEEQVEHADGDQAEELVEHGNEDRPRMCVAMKAHVAAIARATHYGN